MYNLPTYNNIQHTFESDTIYSLCEAVTDDDGAIMIWFALDDDGDGDNVDCDSIQ